MILPRPDAPLGLVTMLPHYSPDTFPATSAVLCRNTAPLIEFALALLRRSVACHVVGRDLCAGLERLLDKGGDYGMAAALRKCKTKSQAEACHDKYAALHTLLTANANDVPRTKAALQRLFAAGPGVTLSTIHRAKGLEWETVFLLEWALLPSPYAETPTAKQQEKNLQYVAVTRAKLNLHFIKLGQWQ